MRRDIAGVGGFVEDLPVLLFILMGTVSVITTSVWVAEGREKAKALADADEAAKRLVDAVLLRLSGGEANGVSIAGLRSLNASQVNELCPSILSWQLSISIFHPRPEAVEHGCDGPGVGASGSGYHNRFVNASYDRDASALVEVRCVVWLS
ncbi:MAG: hypothetical protein JSV90_01440 [Methanobacteriota archaeon]|nr:MAG: hypothetical protein JSV90_01440 [Euryarchaeota archaeon]